VKCNYEGKRIDTLEGKRLLPYRRKNADDFRRTLSACAEPCGCHISKIWKEPITLPPEWSQSRPMLNKGSREGNANAWVLIRIGALLASATSFRGGQRQRIAYAAAWRVDTSELLWRDELISALDCSIQAQVLDLMNGRPGSRQCLP